MYKNISNKIICLVITLNSLRNKKHLYTECTFYARFTQCKKQISLKILNDIL